MNQLSKKILISPTMWFAAAVVFLSRLLQKPSAAVWRNGLRIHCGTKNGQGAYCAIAGLKYEPELLWILSQLNNRDTFIDVGANIGIYSLFAAKKVGEHGRVFAIEPSAGASGMLNKNIVSNHLSKTIVLINAAASNCYGHFYMSGNPSKWNELQLSCDPTGYRVPVVTIDGIYAQYSILNSRVACIKIDAEGEEMKILEGARKTLEIYKPAIVFENTFDNTKLTTAEWLKRKGYKIGFINKENKFAPIEDFRGCANLVGIFSGVL